MNFFLKHWKEYRVAFCATLIMVSAGNFIGWTSPSLPHLTGSDSEIPLSSDEASWVASIMILFSVVSAIPTAYFADKMGRKLCLLGAAVPYALGWICKILAKDIKLLIAGRILGGIGYGIIYTVAPMYLGEISTDEIRGSLAILITVMNKLGIFMQYCIGPYVNLTVLASISLVIPVLFFICFVWFPESPYYYVKTNNTADAVKSLNRLRISSENNAEMKKIETTVAEDMEEKADWSELYTDRCNLKALLLVLALFATQQFCGSAAIVTYAQSIFEQAKTNLKPEDSTMIFGLVQLIVAVISFILVDKYGRRTLLIISSFGVFAMNFLIGVYFYLNRNDGFLNEWRILPLCFIVIYIIAYAIGLSTVPLAVTSELFPTNIKSKATCVVQIFVGLTTFATTKLFQVISDSAGEYTTFWVFAAFSLLGFVIISVFLPETKGESFHVIQSKLRHRGGTNKNQIKDCETPM